MNPNLIQPILDAVVDGIITIDHQGIVQSFNPGAEKIFGYACDEVLGENVSMLMAAPYQAAHDGYLSNYIRTGVAKIICIGREVRGRRKSGDEFPLYLAVNELPTEVAGRSFIGILRDLTKIKKAERLLKESEEKYRRLVDAAPMPILVHNEGIVRFANPAAVKTLGGSGEGQLLGRQVWSLVSGEEKGASRKRKKLSQINDQSRPSTRQKFVRLDDTEIDVQVGSVRIEFAGEPAALVIFRDVTEETKAQKLLRLLANACPSLVSYVGSDGVYQFVNNAYEDWYGKTADEIIGLHVSQLHSAKQYESIKPLLTSALSGQSVNFEIEMKDVLSSPRSIQGHLIPDVDRHGDVAGYFVFSIDVTELKRREAELRHAQKLEAVGRLTGGISHDFNNLLAVVYGNAVLLRDSIEAGPVDQKESLELVDDILSASKGGAKLIERLLAFSRPQALEPKHVDVDAVIGNLASMLRRTLGETIDLVIASRPDDHWITYADVTQLESAILNLAINGRDAMPLGGNLIIETVDVTLDAMFKSSSVATESGDYVMISVSDTGAGMAPAIRERAIEPFFTTKDVGEGSGLGLSMVLGFLSQSGGHIELYSEPGFGTSVKLYLPRAEPT